MDSSAIPVIALAILAIIAIASFVVFRQRVNLQITGPAGTGMKLDASNDSPARVPGVDVSGNKAGGKLDAENELGDGVRVKDNDVKGDLRAVNRRTNPENDPKA